MTESDRGRTRRSLRERLRARPGLTASVSVVALAAIVFVLVWFQPQALLFDRVVDEEFPAATSTVGQTDPARPDVDEPADTDPPPVAEVDAEADQDIDEPAGPIALATGSFASRGRYTVVGTATVFELEDGSRTLRLEDFESTNGPDLYVYLTVADEADPDDALDEDVVDLGVLRGNVGSQNYDLPAGVDLSRHDTVVIWCLRFTAAFGAADLTLS